jgi:hypothetical protein
MGARPGEVGPDRAVRYLPTAALVVRRSALAEGFDPALRVGEDVDLVWRLVAAGWRVRYEPSATVHHREPARWSDLLARRFRYGTSAAPLAERHPDHLAPVELRPWPTAAVAALLAGRPASSAALVAAAGIRMAATLGPRGVPVGRALAWSRGRRAAVAAGLLVVTPPMVEWVQRRPRIDPARWVVASVIDDMAYGVGVWSGCLSSRSYTAVLPAPRLGRTQPVAGSGGRGGPPPTLTIPAPTLNGETVRTV